MPDLGANKILVEKQKLMRPTTNNVHFAIIVAGVVLSLMACVIAVLFI